jgi:hypothetical protein
MKISDLSLDNLENKRSIVDGIYWLIKAYELDKVWLEMESRGDVESRIWITLSFEYQRRHYAVQGQRPDIVKERLYKLLRNLGIEK